jgi:molybdenum cofactor cytidylyltransferase
MFRIESNGRHWEFEMSRGRSSAFAIIPAAGRSDRMGTAKLLLPLGGKTIIENTMDAWRSSGVDRVLVVARADDAPLAALVRACGATCLPADPPPPDMKASVQAGLNYLAAIEQPATGDVWLTAPADLPSFSGEVVRRLLAAHNPDSPRVLVAGHEGRRGHPALFPWSFADELAKLAPDEGRNRLVERSGALIVECGMEALCADLDTPDDYRRWQRNTVVPHERLA